VKRFSYAGSQFLTGDAIASAVFDYSAALADAGQADTIEVPILKEDGSKGTAMVLVGPASQIVASDAETDFDELEDQEAVSRIRTMVRRLRPAAVFESEAPDQGSEDWDRFL
jgi:hypothetical protein